MTDTVYSFIRDLVELNVLPSCTATYPPVSGSDIARSTGTTRCRIILSIVVANSH